MIKNFIDKLLSKAPGARKRAANPYGKRVEVPASVHGIDPELVDRAPSTWCAPSSRPVSRPTSSAVPCATCCWACAPRTFDVATNATPEQVKGLFRRAFIIGGAFASCTWCTGAGVSTR
jgi:poly(A) polymerase